MEMTNQEAIEAIKMALAQVEWDYGSHREVCKYCYKCSLWTQGESTNNNDLPHCQHMDEEIAQSFKEDVEAVKDQLPCGQMMDFPKTFDEFVKDYGFKDKQEIYTNGSELIPVFRVKQWLEHISTTKNDLGVDCISRVDVLNNLTNIAKVKAKSDAQKSLMGRCMFMVERMPSLTPQEPILDKVRAELENKLDNINRLYNQDNQYDDGAIDSLQYALDIIDKYKAESEDKK